MLYDKKELSEKQQQLYNASDDGNRFFTDASSGIFKSSEDLVNCADWIMGKQDPAVPAAEATPELPQFGSLNVVATVGSTAESIIEDQEEHQSYGMVSGTEKKRTAAEQFGQGKRPKQAPPLTQSPANSSNDVAPARGGNINALQANGNVARKARLTSADEMCNDEGGWLEPFMSARCGKRVIEAVKAAVAQLVLLSDEGNVTKNKKAWLSAIGKLQANTPKPAKGMELCIERCHVLTDALTHGAEIHSNYMIMRKKEDERKRASKIKRRCVDALCISNSMEAFEAYSCQRVAFGVLRATLVDDYIPLPPGILHM